MALIIPEVYSNLVREKFLGRVKVMNLAQNVGILKNTTQGDTITFPKWKTLTDVNLVVKGTQSAIDSLDQDSSTATIKMYDKIVRIFDIDDMSVLGSSIQESASQMAVVFGRHIDDDLIAEAKLGAYKSAVAGATAITATELNTAFGYFADEVDIEDFAGIVVNSLLLPAFYAMPEFVDATKTYNTMGNGLVRNGLVGFFRGVAIFVSNKGTYDSTLNECVSFIIKKGSLGYMEKTNINIVEEREEKLHCSDVVGTYTYAVKILDESGIVQIRKTVA
jgi:hypothetical protein